MTINVTAAVIFPVIRRYKIYIYVLREILKIWHLYYKCQIFDTNNDASGFGGRGFFVDKTIKLLTKGKIKREN